MGRKRREGKEEERGQRKRWYRNRKGSREGSKKKEIRREEEGKEKGKHEGRAGSGIIHSGCSKSPAR